jgi:ferrous iron transport protein A
MQEGQKAKRIAQGESARQQKKKVELHVLAAPIWRDQEKMKTIDLTKLEWGESGTVVEINGGHGLVRRLESLGIRAGTKVTKVSSQLLRGPVTLRVNSFQVALGFGMARRVLVEKRHKG